MTGIHAIGESSEYLLGHTTHRVVEHHGKAVKGAGSALVIKKMQ
jgi:hypothetical protein